MNSAMKSENKAVIQKGDRFLYFLSLVFFVLISCNQNENVIVGSWIQPIPGQSGKVQGIRLDSDGKASSINMQTLLYETWEQQGEKIILTGKSIGNGQTILFSDTLKVDKLTADTLVLRKGNFERVYIRNVQDKQ
jgi:hypothetical protein